MWEGRDSFDEVRAKYDAVNEDNCAIKHVADLKLPEDTVSHLPDIKEVNINPVFPNRTALLHLHNMALNRAFFFSYILQSRFHRPAINATYDPGMMYFFLSTIADVAANPKINSSGVYFSPEMAYTPSYK
ncbi:Putative LOC100882757, partial [Caligus rogercresseyi]